MTTDCEHHAPVYEIPESANEVSRFVQCSICNRIGVRQWMQLPDRGPFQVLNWAELPREPSSAVPADDDPVWDRTAAWNEGYTAGRSAGLEESREPQVPLPPYWTHTTSTYWYGGHAAAVQEKADCWMVYVPPGAVPPVSAPSLEAAMKVAERMVAAQPVAPGDRVKINVKLGPGRGELATVTEIRGTEVHIKMPDGFEGFTDISNVERVPKETPLVGARVRIKEAYGLARAGEQGTVSYVEGDNVTVVVDGPKVEAVIVPFANVERGYKGTSEGNDR